MQMATRRAIHGAGLFLSVLVACGGEADLDGSEEGEGSRTISGRVVSRRGLPLEGLLLHVGDASARTDADGRFELRGAWSGEDERYDLFAVCRPPEVDIDSAPCAGTDVRHASLALYHGLEQEEVSLVWHTSGNARLIEVELPTVSFPLPDGDVLRWGVDHPAVYESPSSITPSGHAAGVARWGHATEIDVRVAALHVSAPPEGSELYRRPVAYPGFGAVPTRLADSLSGDPHVVSLPLAPLAIAATALTGEVTLPASYALREKNFTLTLGDATFAAGFDGRPDQPRDFEFAPPASSELLPGVCAVATDPAQSAVERPPTAIACLSTSAAGPLAIPVPELVRPTLPEAAAIVGPRPTLRWDAPADTTLNVVQVSLGEPLEAIEMTVFSATPEVVLPDLGAYDLGLDATAAVRWSVLATNHRTLADQAEGNAGSILFPVTPEDGVLRWQAGSPEVAFELRAD